jgi:hypothetical protein
MPASPGSPPVAPASRGGTWPPGPSRSYTGTSGVCRSRAWPPSPPHPMAGDHGELTGALMRPNTTPTRATPKKQVHLSGPAPAPTRTRRHRRIRGGEHRSKRHHDPEALAAALDDRVAGVMMTVPNTRPVESTAAHRGAVPRGGRPSVLRRREPERHLRQAAWATRASSGALKPAQDLRHPHGGGVPVPARLESPSGSSPPARLPVFKAVPTLQHALRTTQSIGYVAPFYGNLRGGAHGLRYLPGPRGSAPRLGACRAAATYCAYAWRTSSRCPSTHLHARVRWPRRTPGQTRRARHGHRQALLDGATTPHGIFPAHGKEAFMFEPSETESRTPWTPRGRLREFLAPPWRDRSAAVPPHP